MTFKVLTYVLLFFRQSPTAPQFNGEGEEGCNQPIFRERKVLHKFFTNAQIHTCSRQAGKQTHNGGVSSFPLIVSYCY